VEDVDTIVRTTFGFRLGFFGPFAIADQAGLDVYENCFRTFEEAFGERLSTPQMISDAVAADRKGVKNGKGITGDFDDETKAELIAYRNRAYKRMSDLLRELGPAPKGKPSAWPRPSSPASAGRSGRPATPRPGAAVLPGAGQPAGGPTPTPSKVNHERHPSVRRGQRHAGRTARRCTRRHRDRRDCGPALPHHQGPSARVLRPHRRQSRDGAGGRDRRRGRGHGRR